MPHPRTLRISARERWSHTGFQLEKNAQYRITVAPNQHWYDFFIKYGPDGGITGPLQRKFADKLRFKGDAARPAQYFTLIGTIGESLEHAFIIGSGTVEFTAPADGELVCFANDVNAAYWNNFGEMDIAVERL